MVFKMLQESFKNMIRRVSETVSLINSNVFSMTLENWKLKESNIPLCKFSDKNTCCAFYLFQTCHSSDYVYILTIRLLSITISFAYSCISTLFRIL